MKAVTLPQPHASLVAAGVQTIVTLPRSTDWRGDLLIHAGARWAPGWSMRSLWHQPEDGSEAELKATLLAEACGGEWVESIDGDQWWTADGRFLPLGAVVAVARVTDCVPIVACPSDTPADQSACILSDEELSVWGRPWLGVQRADRIRGDGITDQLPYADFTPGRWALLLDDVRPLPEPVPAKGRPGVWTPDDDLTDHINKEMTP